MNLLSRSKATIASTVALLASAFSFGAASSAPTTSLNAAQGIQQAGGYVPIDALPVENLAVNVAPNHIGGGPAVIRRSPGLTPKQWGMSAACRKMVRKNRFIARGISAQRI